MAELEEMRLNAHREKAEAELVKIHPDFIEIRQDDAFHNWAKDNLNGYKMLCMKM